MSSTTRAVRDTHQKNLVKLFDSLCGHQSRWTVWSDFITMAAISVSNVVDRVHADEREKTYMALAEKWDGKELELFGQMLAEIVLGMEDNPDQDFLGELFMLLELSNDHNGQFFTPYNVCKMMSQLVGGDIQAHIDAKGWAGVNDPACGAGALLVAYANSLKDAGINYQTSVLFVAQDIDFIVGCMCYLQLSLMGCAGYVVVANTITEPSTSYDKRGLLPRDRGNVWYTPMYFSDVWTLRKLWAKINLTMPIGDIPKKETPLEVPPPPKELPKPQPAPEAPEPAAEAVEYTASEGGQLSFF